MRGNQFEENFTTLDFGEILFGVISKREREIWISTKPDFFRWWKRQGGLFSKVYTTYEWRRGQWEEQVSLLQSKPKWVFHPVKDLIIPVSEGEIEVRSLAEDIYKIPVHGDSISHPGADFFLQCFGGGKHLQNNFFFEIVLHRRPGYAGNTDHVLWNLTNYSEDWNRSVQVESVVLVLDNRYRNKLPKSHYLWLILLPNVKAWVKVQFETVRHSHLQATASPRT